MYELSTGILLISKQNNKQFLCIGMHTLMRLWFFSIVLYSPSHPHKCMHASHYM